jgi:hypothetical protein
MSDKQLANKANMLFAEAREWKDDEKRQEKCWDFIIENIPYIGLTPQQQ